MSYQSKKIKKSKVKKLGFFVKQILIFFLKKIKGFKKGGRKMQNLQTKRVMDSLREKRKKLGKGFRVDNWVDRYLEKCFQNGERVTILTPWSFSTALKTRFKIQGDKFIPTDKEEKLFKRRIPEVLDIFKSNGFRVDWWILLARSCLKSRLIGEGLERQYQDMIEGLVKPLAGRGLTVANLEDDIFGERVVPDKEVVRRLEEYIDKKTIDLETQKWQEWVNATGFEASVEQIIKETREQVAGIIKEGEMLASPNFELGPDFLLFLLESPENIFYLTIRAPQLNQRMVTIFPYFPWRLSEKG